MLHPSLCLSVSPSVHSIFSKSERRRNLKVGGDITLDTSKGNLRSKGHWNKNVKIFFSSVFSLFGENASFL